LIITIHYIHKTYIPSDRWSLDHFSKKHWPNSALRCGSRSLYLGCQSSNSGLFQNYSLCLKIHTGVLKKKNRLNHDKFRDELFCILTRLDIVVVDGDELIPVWSVLFVHESCGVEHFVHYRTLLRQTSRTL